MGGRRHLICFLLWVPWDHPSASVQYFSKSHQSVTVSMGPLLGLADHDFLDSLIDLIEHVDHEGR
jgi:hypothetical protein